MFEQTQARAPGTVRPAQEPPMTSRRLAALLAALALVACGPMEADLEEPLPDSTQWTRFDTSELRRRVDPCSMTGRRAVPLEVFAQPEVAEQPFLDALAGARRSVRVMVYQLTSPTIREALRAKAAAGVPVRVILDGEQKRSNQTSFDVLTTAGAQVQWSDPRFTYTHAKFVVVDDAVALVTSSNFDGYMRSGRNFGAVDRDVSDVRGLAQLFDADWTGTEPSLACTRLVVSPTNARERHLSLLRGATRTLEIESMQFSDWDIRNAVLERHRAGVAVRVLLAAPAWVSANDAAGGWLVGQGIDARWRSSPAVHAKAIVVDGRRAFLGSENLSRTSLSYNREVGLVTTEADDLEVLAGTFERDWATATRF